jgi:hypothetical protein
VIFASSLASSINQKYTNQLNNDLGPTVQYLTKWLSLQGRKKDRGRAGADR